MGIVGEGDLHARHRQRERARLLLQHLHREAEAADLLLKTLRWERLRGKEVEVHRQPVPDAQGNCRAAGEDEPRPAAIGARAFRTLRASGVRHSRCMAGLQPELPEVPRARREPAARAADLDEERRRVLPLRPPQRVQAAELEDPLDDVPAVPPQMQLPGVHVPEQRPQPVGDALPSSTAALRARTAGCPAGPR